MRRWLYLASLAALLLAGTALRWRLLQRWELHVDESLYADATRHLVESGDLLLNGVRSDKPPLLYWAQAPFFVLLGPSALSARLPGLLAWALSAAFLLGALAWVWDPPAAIVAGAVWCLSPFGVLFMPTGFTDPLMAAWGLAGFLCLLRRQAGAAGLCLGLALASKQTALLYLAPAILLLRDRDEAAAFFKSFAAVLAPLLLWSAIFEDQRFDLWLRAAEYARAPAAQSLALRWQQLSGIMAWTGGSLAGNLGLGLLALAALFGRLREGRVLAGAVLAYALFLTLSHGQLYDRYWLFALPLLALACGAAVARLPQAGAWAVAVAMVLALGFAWDLPGTAWGYGAENQGFAEAQRWLQDGRGQAGETLTFVGEPPVAGWKALFYLRPGRRQAYHQAAAASLADAHETGWAVSLQAQAGHAPDFESKDGLRLWRIGPAIVRAGAGTGA
jgi:4-amino-4-deoxy-L-arabinose transferase-like glycosyltransferase